VQSLTPIGQHTPAHHWGGGGGVSHPQHQRRPPHRPLTRRELQLQQGVGPQRGGAAPARAAVPKGRHTRWAERLEALDQAGKWGRQHHARMTSVAGHERRWQPPCVSRSIAIADRSSSSPGW
jgi:hypothetical protein